MGHNANLRFWKAWEDHREPGRDFDTSKRTLIVTGKVEVDAATMPILEEDAGRRSGSNTLYLQFNFSRFVGGNSWKPVWFQKEIKSREYEEVQLLIDGNPATGGRLEIEPSPAISSQNG